MIDDLMKGLLTGTQIPLLAYNDMIINLGTCAITCNKESKDEDIHN